MLYRNKKTGTQIESKALIAGENWEPVEKEPKEEKKRAKKNGE